MREDNDFADVTLACEDGEQVEAHKVILAGQVLFNKLSHSHHHINNIFINININSVEQQARGCSCRWADAQLPTFPPTQVRVYQLPVGVDGLASLA